MFQFDFWKPLYFKLEKSVAGKQIPAVYNLPNRKRSADITPVSKESFDHSKWDAILGKYVSTEHTIGDVTGIHCVDYQQLAQDPDFDLYLNQLKQADPTTLPEPDQLAFWMNTYNAFCISLLVNCVKEDKLDGIASINDLSESGGKAVWDLPAGEVGGRTLSLNQVEHDELRKQWAEPAVHGCIVCASASCPNLRPEAFAACRVSEQMDDQMKQWMANPTKGLKLDGNRLCLSRIFLWFEDDFGGKQGLREWLPQYVEDETLKERIRNGSDAVRYFDYSWKMNRKSTSTTSDA